MVFVFQKILSQNQYVLRWFIYYSTLGRSTTQGENMSKEKKTTKTETITEDDEEVLVIDAEEPEITVEDLPGVGPATAEKLREAGFNELLAIAVMTPKSLADAAELGEAVSSKIINSAKKLANIGGFVSGNSLMERRRQVLKLSLSLIHI